MGQYLQRIEGDTAAQLERAEGELAAPGKSKGWEETKTAADFKPSSRNYRTLPVST